MDSLTAVGCAGSLALSLAATDELVAHDLTELRTQALTAIAAAHGEGADSLTDLLADSLTHWLGRTG